MGLWCGCLHRYKRWNLDYTGFYRITIAILPGEGTVDHNVLPCKMLRKVYMFHLLGSHFQVSLMLKLVVKKQWLIFSVRNVAGNETKLGMSKGLPEPKLTAADGMVDKLTGALFAFQLVVVLILGVAGNTWKLYEADKVCGVLYNINAFFFL